MKLIKMNVIDKIIKNKKESVNISKKHTSPDTIKKDAIDYTSTLSRKHEFQDKLKDKSCQLICEYKVASPSKGHISDLNIKDVIEVYDKSPVDMISILTEESYFESNLKNLKEAKTYTKKPLLRKDFFIDEYMIYEAAINDASCILLIEGVCPDIEEYLNISCELGLDAIVECHTIEDILNVEKYNPQIIGVNNRNLKDFTIDLETTKELKQYVPNYMISESGVTCSEDARLLKSYGADGILIGSSILENNDKEKIDLYINDLKKSLM